MNSGIPLPRASRKVVRPRPQQRYGGRNTESLPRVPKAGQRKKARDNGAGTIEVASDRRVPDRGRRGALIHSSSHRTRHDRRWMTQRGLARAFRVHHAFGASQSDGGASGRASGADWASPLARALTAGPVRALPTCPRGGQVLFSLPRHDGAIPRPGDVLPRPDGMLPRPGNATRPVPGWAAPAQVWPVSP